MCEEYQGWENYATWAAFTWAVGDRASYLYWLDVARQCRRDAQVRPEPYPFPEGEVTRIRLAERLQEELTASPVAEKANLDGDLLTWAFGKVNWQHVARGILEQEDAQGEELGDDV